MTARTTEVWTDVGQARLRALHGGEHGEHVVLVPGFMIGLSYLEPLLVRLAPHVRPWAVDLPGHGRSPDPDRPHGIADHVEALATWLDTRTGRSVIVANSLGTQVAIQLAAARPDLVRGLVLTGPVMDPTARTLPRQAARLLADLPLERPVHVWRQLVGLVRTHVGTGWREVRTGLRQPEEELLRQVSAPVLVVRGEQDTLVPRWWARRVTRLLGDARLVEVPDNPHAVNDNAPDVTARLVLDFVRSLPTRENITRDDDCQVADAG